MPRPLDTEYAPFYTNYVALATGESIDELLNKHSQHIESFIQQLPAKKAHDTYAVGKWSLSTLLQHMLDAERIFAYRLLRISRADSTPLPSFDEDAYAKASEQIHRDFEAIREEFLFIRKSTDLLLASLSTQQLANTGTASNHTISTNALAFILYGHNLHHLHIIKERYL
jgi:uncharacterized damage-inducible protein DinB